ncbi:MAG: peptidoglycan-binding protein, partial [Candidatus Sericytochromatia bacterium]|nr:peptidoglycan-binding protein [Candidatus Tanganyikabacteria bacterium]
EPRPARQPAPVRAPASGPGPSGLPEPRKPRLKTTGGSGPLLRKTARGTPVARLQRRLARFGIDPGPVDGVFGPRTERAVRRFQQRFDLAIDGVVGPRTWNRLGIAVQGKVRYPAPGAGRNSNRRTDIGGPQPAVIRQGKYIGAGIAAAFDRMVAAARRDGIDLVINSGYRTRAEQERLWRANPNPRYVAPPGTSNHEKGNAIDFLGTPGAWAWLRRNGGRFGFYNYPPEPWHYSTNGR